MIEQSVTIVNKLGLHARAAAKLVTCASWFVSSVQLDYNGQVVNGKSIMGVMMLAAAKESELLLRVEGEDEAEAAEALTALIADRFGENE
ncbi:MAG: HPr family phosphocarrier protein [Candidatus Polarisedimenticolaceae bacterium]|nr:HPr family phosphocarrier protein [Candidatus Polarisedimenticolaceae bacterium]